MTHRSLKVLFHVAHWCLQFGCDFSDSQTAEICQRKNVALCVR